MATYLDVYAAVRRGVRYARDLAVELYQPQSAVEMAAVALVRAGLLTQVHHPGGTRIEVHADVSDEASALRKAKSAGFNLNAELLGGRVSRYPGPR
jgi:DNA-binding MarR family transcriptional regulator